ncbi:aminoglycoside 3'-phosphotransferase [Paenibacillus sp. N4]|uniref:aminoglycoside 3'-phosphotransferase n=1 Tax=Paenibacillus vietnamensis TaxID=2590547 RepID=UPI001CD15EBF|nr:aminoglycoside 3'-phosphotransferase [Paenibacillus vietnamensis]MCA0758172.1 aminoglycoside 3'-phosphotransferase [Paenibacillus vietnamensis]
MKKTEVSFDIGTSPPAIARYMQSAAIYDSSCSETARTLFVKGAQSAFLKISPKGTLEREYKMTDFLHSFQAAPKAIAYESDSAYDYLLTEVVSGDDGAEQLHLENPEKLAAVFGQYLKMLHSLPVEGCPYRNRTTELLNDAINKGIDLSAVHEIAYSPVDNVIIHGDYCLPNIIMDHFAFKGFIDLGDGGVGDRHNDLYWGLWTLRYNLKTDKYKDIFLDAYGREKIDAAGLNYFTRLMELAG